MRDREVLEGVSRLTALPIWGLLKSEAEKKLAANERTIMQLLFKTRSEVLPLEIEYFRGFRQGVNFVLEGLPNSIRAEYQKELESDKEGDEVE